MVLSVLLHPPGGGRFLGRFRTGGRAIRLPAVERELLPAPLAGLDGPVCEYGFERRVKRQHAVLEILAQAAGVKRDGEHVAGSVQRQALVFVVVIGALRSDQPADGALLSGGQFTGIAQIKPSFPFGIERNQIF